MEPIYQLRCLSCKTPAINVDRVCSKCGGKLEYTFSKNYLKNVKFSGTTLWRYSPVLPKISEPVSLGEGGTPIHRSDRLAESVGLENLLLKDETQNPTSSFKDRSASLIISDALGRGFTSVVCATNGNHGASIAAYSAKKDISCHLIVPKSVDMGKLAQMMVYNTEIVEAGDTIEEAIDRSKKLVEETGWYQATSEFNPLSIEGIKTISYEIFEQERDVDWIAISMGSGLTIHSIWKGLNELELIGIIDKKPKLIGVQAKGCSPIINALSEESINAKIEKGETDAIAIRVAKPVYGKLAMKAIRESGGIGVTVTDDEMISSGREIAKYEGIFAEPASAATVACLNKLTENGKIDRTDNVVSIITSSGLKTDDILSSITKRKKSTGLGSRFTTKERILRLIANEDTYGYEIWKKLGIDLTIGAVYQHLSDLEKKGLITSYAKGKRKMLRITERGKRVISALDELQVLL